MSEQCGCVMHSESDRIVWDGSDCPLHYDQGGMMSKYTAEDFARATLATRGELDVASRVDPGGGAPWRYIARNGSAGWRSDKEMAFDGWTPVAETPITLDALAAAWEAAEVPTEEAPIREGDTVISPHYGGRMFNVFEFEGGGRFSAQPNYRVLSRAPRAPWQDLADDLADRSALMDEEAIEAAAKALHAAGWRKGGETSE